MLSRDDYVPIRLTCQICFQVNVVHGHLFPDIFDCENCGERNIITTFRPEECEKWVVCPEVGCRLLYPIIDKSVPEVLLPCGACSRDGPMDDFPWAKELVEVRLSIQPTFFLVWIIFVSLGTFLFFATEYF